MNFLRILLLAGVAVSVYLMMYQWQQDYYVKPAELAHNNPVDPSEPSLVDQDAISPANNIPLLDSISNEGSHDKSSYVTTNDDLPEVNVVPEIDAVDQISDVNQDSLASRFIEVHTDVFSLKIDLLGGDIVKSALVDYPVSVEYPDIPFDLLNDKAGEKYSAQSGIIGKSGKDFDGLNSRPLYKSEVSSYKMSGDSLEVVLLYVNPQGLDVKKKYHFEAGNYLIKTSYELVNNSTANWIGSPFSQVKRENFPDPTSSSYTGMATFLGAAYWLPDEKFNKLDLDDIEDAAEKRKKALDEKIRGGWVAFIQHYFLVSWIPESENLNRYFAKYLERTDEFVVGLTTPVITVQPGESKTVESASLYIGPKIQSSLKEISDGLDLSVDYGFLFFISSALFQALEWIHSKIGNWGWSIVLLTFLIKGLFYYPSAMSYRSMAKMRKFQPELLRLKEKYGEDRQKFSQEMMKLYQKEKINPLGGCLPILMQMPVFLALYWALLESVELRQAEFIFWIKDLASMDQYFVLPILMGVSMYVQTSLNPTPPDPMQAKVMKFMPFIFTVFFLFFPSGLVLYWLTNNLLSIAQQWWITKKIEQETS